GLLLSWEGSFAPGASPWGPLAIAGACLGWALDNNLPRRVSGGDPLLIASAKGLVAGTVNLVIAFAARARPPDFRTVGEAGVVGLLGYGAGLTLFVLALRHLGTARPGAFFSLAPFVGAAASLLIFREIPGVLFVAASALMALGVWLHLTERHEHEHEHEPVE